MLTENDKAKRIGKITSSTAAGCLGLDERITPIGAWLLITGQAGDITEDPAIAKACDRGNRLEDLILDYGVDEVASLFGQPAIRTPAPFRRHPGYEWSGDSCDALYFPDNGHVDPKDPYGELLAIGEGKSASMGVFLEYGEDGTDEMPHHTLIQSHFHLEHWPEVDVCIVPVLGGGYRFEFRNLIVRRDSEFSGEMMQDLEKFHRDYVVTMKPPPAEAGDGKYLRGKHPESDGLAIADTPEIKALAIDKMLASKARKHAEKQETAAKNRLIQILGDHELVKAEWGKISYRQAQSSLKVDWETIALELMDRFEMPKDDRMTIIGDNTEEKPGSRRFLVTPTKQVKKELGL